MSKTLEIKILTQLQDKLSAPLKNLIGVSKTADKQFQALKDKVRRGLEKQERSIEQFKKLELALQTTSDKIAIARGKFDELNTQLKSSINPSQALIAKVNQAKLSVESLNQRQSEQSQKLSDVKSKLESAGISTKNLASHENQLKNQLSTANTELLKHRSELQKVIDKQNKLAAAKDRMAKTQQFASNMAVTGTAAYMSGRKVLDSMAGVVKPGVDFDSSMSKVQSLTRLEKGSKELEMLRQQARDLGASTMFSATEAADAQGFLAMAGFTPDAIQKAMPGMLDLAKAGGTDLAVTADISSNILSGMKLDPSEMARVGDVLTGAFTRSNTNLEMLGETMKYAAPMAASLNVDIETLAAATGKLGDAGIQGSMAGTALRSILNRLSAPPKAAAKALNQLNISTTDAKGNLRDFPSILEELNRKTQKMGSAKRAEFFKAIAGEEAVSSLNVLVDKAATGELQGFVRTLKNAGGEATKVAKTMSDNIIGDLDELSSAWEDVGISIFDGQKSLLRGLVQSITGIVNKIGAWVRANPELTATIIKIVSGIAAIVAMLGALSIALASVIGPFAMMKFAVSYLGIQGFGLVGILGKLGSALKLVGTVVMTIGRALLMNPIGLILTGIAVAGYLIWKNWDYLKAKAIEIWNSIQQAFSSGWNWITSLVSTAGSTLLGAMSAIWNGWKNGVANVWNSVQQAFSSGWNWITSLVSTAGSTLLGAMSAIWNGWKNSVANVWNSVQQAFSTGWNNLTNLANTAGMTVSNAVSTVWNGLTTTASTVWTSIKEKFTSGLSSITSILSTFNPITALQNAFNGTVTLFANLQTKFTEFGGQLISGLVNGIKNMAGKAKEAISEVGSGVIGWFKQKLGIHSPSRVFAEMGGFVSEGLSEGIARTANLPIKSMKTMAMAVTAAGALSPMVATAGQIQFDTRPAMTSTNAVPASQMTMMGMGGGDVFNITINTTSNQSAQDIARIVQQEIARAQSQKQARLRSSYTDY